jgi:hypothetical protein
MPRFTIDELLRAITLVSFGAGMVLFSISLRTCVFPNPGMALTWCCAGALIGAGLFTPFQRPLCGAAIGVAVQVGIMIAA